MLIGLSAIVCEVGRVGAAADWWPLAEAVAEGGVQANVVWLRRRDLDAFALERLGLRYAPRPALRVGSELAQALRRFQTGPHRHRCQRRRLLPYRCDQGQGTQTRQSRG